MNNIAEQEYKDVLGRIGNEILDKQDEFASYDDWEDTYSHNEVDKAQEQLINALNEYFEAKEIDYIAFEGCNCVKVWKTELYNKRLNKKEKKHE